MAWIATVQAQHIHARNPDSSYTPNERKESRKTKEKERKKIHFEKKKEEHEAKAPLRTGQFHQSFTALIRLGIINVLE